MKLIISLLACLLVCGAVTMAAVWNDSQVPEAITQDPLWVITRLTAAINEKKFEGAMPLFADAIQLEIVPVKHSSDPQGVRGWLASQSRAYERVEISDIWLKGDTVVWVVREYRAGKVTHSRNCAEIRGGHIQSLKSVQLISFGAEGAAPWYVADDPMLSCEGADVAWLKDEP